MEYFKDKVIVNNYYTLKPNEDGSYDSSSIVAVSQTLEEYLEQLAEEEEGGEEAEGEEAENEDAEGGEADGGETDGGEEAEEPEEEPAE